MIIEIYTKVKNSFINENKLTTMVRELLNKYDDKNTGVIMKEWLNLKSIRKVTPYTNKHAVLLLNEALINLKIIDAKSFQIIENVLSKKPTF